MARSASQLRQILPPTAAVDLERDGHIAENLLILRQQFRAVLKLRQPELLAPFEGMGTLEELGLDLLPRAMQAYGIWLQLLTIAEENAALRERRRIEREGGPDAVPGSLSHVVAQLAAANVPAANITALLANAKISPVLTAHPTEAKRVTVLEIHRRIYRLLFDLEASRWTPNERAALLERLWSEIDLLWVTGELRLERPTVEQEIAWGLHFFEETIFHAYRSFMNDWRPPFSGTIQRRSSIHLRSSRSVPGLAATATATRSLPPQPPRGRSIQAGASALIVGGVRSKR